MRKSVVIPSLICLILAPAIGAAADPVPSISLPFTIEPSFDVSAFASNDAGWTAVAWLPDFSGAAGEITIQRYRHGERFGEPARVSTVVSLIQVEMAIDRAGGIILVSVENGCPVCSPPPADDSYLYRISPANELLEEPRLLPSGARSVVNMEDSGAFRLLTPSLVSEGPGLVLSRFDSRADPVGEGTGFGVLVNRYPLSYDLATNARGASLAVWDEASFCDVEVCSGSGLFGQLFDSAGAAIGPTFQLAERSTGGSVVSLRDGRFLVLWNEPMTAEARNPALVAVRARVVAEGEVGEAFTVSPAGALGFGPVDWWSPGAHPRAAVDTSGNVIALWMRDYESALRSGVMVQPLDPDRGSLGSPKLLSQNGQGFSGDLAILAEGPGTFLAAWRERIESSTALLGRRLTLEPETGCVSSGLRICFLDGRFELTGQFRRPSGQLDMIRFQALGDGSGYGSFLRQGNAELLVKMLDGRGINGHFWFFSGGLSNVEYNLTLRDLQTGGGREYRKPTGILGSFGDVRAFEEAAAPASTTAPSIFAPSASSFSALASSASLPASATGCLPTDSQLCIEGGRFSVALQWRDRRGNEGSGSAALLSSDSGVFWFFRRDNPEVMVKVLDGRAVNGNFWVFYASATDVEFTLTVTDTESQVTRTYENSQGTFASGADLRAF